MVKGLGILFALFGGVPLWFWLQAQPSRVPTAAYDVVLSFVLVVGICYGVGALTGYAVRKIRAG